MHRKVLLPVLAALAAACASTQESVAAADEARAGFERMKSLAGDWSGPGGPGAEMELIEVRYRVTAGGSVVEETIMPGTAHEMVTMYYLDGDRLMLTHYCTAGNQPTMISIPGSKNAGAPTLRFEFASATNMDDSNAGHMHEAVYTFVGKDQLQSTWTYWSEGKPGHQANFNLTRKKGA